MSGAGLTITQDQTFAALGSFLTSILPADVPVVQGQGNRVPEPKAKNFVIMVPMRRERIETNVDSFGDIAWIGGISGGVLNVTKVIQGALSPGLTPSANNTLAAKTKLGTQLTGNPGGIGTYNITPTQNVAAGSIFQAGGGTYLQPIKLTVQLDVHGPQSADYAQIISTLFRDDYAVEYFANLNDTGGYVVPLYADDPRQLRFENAEQQVEDRWSIDAALQVNAAATTSQQFADNVVIGLINVDATYPP